jgi:mono/diheme cytochrome c family protein
MRRNVRSAIAAAAAALTFAAAAAAGEGSPGVTKARGEALFRGRCQECHEPAIDRAPPREELAVRTPTQIVEALTTGPMAPIAEDLSAEDKQSIAAYLTAQ